MASDHRTWPVPHFPGDKPAEPPTMSERMAAFLDNETDFVLECRDHRRELPGRHGGGRTPVVSSGLEKPWRKGWPVGKQGKR
jgi:hypothetical protein